MTGNTTGERDGQLASGPIPRRLACLALAGFLSLIGPADVLAFDCPAPRQPSIPKSEEPAINLDKHKKQLRAYVPNGYDKDVKLVLDDALAYVMSRAGKVEHPAVVLDIDETSLSNLKSLLEGDFGNISRGGICSKAPFACGVAERIVLARAKPIEPTVKFVDAIRAKHIAVFFITGRRDSERSTTIRSLHGAGFDDWTGLRMRPDDDKTASIVPYKSGERAKIESGKKPYTILATIGDQQSDLDGGHAECTFKVPNPFYFAE
jgi:HAD superfamily, subfamily IIIB (Acid phosphatase)